MTYRDLLPEWDESETAGGPVITINRTDRMLLAVVLICLVLLMVVR